MYAPINAEKGASYLEQANFMYPSLGKPRTVQHFLIHHGMPVLPVDDTQLYNHSKRA